MFTVTPAAATELLAAAQRSGAAEMALRVAARQAADGSIEYGMGFDDERESDESAEFEGLKVLMAAPSQPLLAGTVLDYVQVAPERFDFVFVPLDEPVAVDGTAPAGPVAQARGGCGSGSCGSCGS